MTDFGGVPIGRFSVGAVTDRPRLVNAIGHDFYTLQDRQGVVLAQGGAELMQRCLAAWTPPVAEPDDLAGGIFG